MCRYSYNALVFYPVLTRISLCWQVFSKTPRYQILRKSCGNTHMTSHLSPLFSQRSRQEEYTSRRKSQLRDIKKEETSFGCPFGGGMPGPRGFVAGQPNNVSPFLMSRSWLFLLDVYSSCCEHWLNRGKRCDVMWAFPQSNWHFFRFLFMCAGRQSSFNRPSAEMVFVLHILLYLVSTVNVI